LREGEERKTRCSVKKGKREEHRRLSIKHRKKGRKEKGEEKNCLRKRKKKKKKKNPQHQGSPQSRKGEKGGLLT